MPTVADCARQLEAWFPPARAASWDNVGLLLGDPQTRVEAILTCLTLTPEVAEEAADTGCQLLVSHHPILFRGVKRLTTATPEGRAVLALARAGVAVHSPHTAFDNAREGINARLGARLGIRESRPLRGLAETRPFKIVVFAPESDWARVAEAMFAAGAGRIGEYRECSFRVPGTGTFFGEESTQPAVGQKGRREEVAEWRLEVVCPEPALGAVLRAMRQAHSYEEPAFDVYPLHAMPGAWGEGRIGALESAVPLGEFAARARRELACGPVQVVGDPGRPIRTVAWACGAAGEFLDDALRAGADLFLTGEMRFHDYLRAQGEGISLILPGHYATERFAVEELAERLGAWDRSLRARASARERDPVTWA